MADDWWGRQKGLRQTPRTEVAIGGSASASVPGAPLNQFDDALRGACAGKVQKHLGAGVEAGRGRCGAGGLASRGVYRTR
jgi:hypothetical protein